ncbi:MAG: succinate dehydrogenase/fumarate reductase iron-sulfur subunit [Nitrospirae bacterium]|nr:MAG: succinate dehydrogenase/fumarate reductase iron-sulfur subunit [Nitrospirota bacterium]
MRITFRIQRFNPEVDRHPHMEDYHLPVWRGMTVLDGLLAIKNTLDGTLALRYSCRSAICGSCAMFINGRERLACRTAVRKMLERSTLIEVMPLTNMRVVKDLVVDMSPFWGKVRAITPWLTKSESTPYRDVSTRAQQVLPRSSDVFQNVDACIMCGACVAACTTHAVSPEFLGPAALAKAARFIADPREPESSKTWRLRELNRPHGLWDCTRCQYCVEVCPKDVKPMEAIIRLRRAAIDRGLTSDGGARHITGFAELIYRDGRLNEAIMPLKVVGFHPARLLHILPLGLKMWLKGKIPSPFGHRLPEITRIRRIFKARQTSQETPS